MPFKKMMKIASGDALRKDNDKLPEEDALQKDNKNRLRGMPFRKMIKIALGVRSSRQTRHFANGGSLRHASSNG
ncbi:hypothetical protein RHGRI_036975 [Rhododendron griersonianum]|uniref:Uncharacterized protein n=1 Tax=Rhododendron griersonianum TaxID=479676 RepID=A0AAV6HQI7_9ERIC|nr:hypothetical protein RHGRI_036975 [Rhododendron griersonianum]